MQQEGVQTVGRVSQLAHLRGGMLNTAGKPMKPVKPVTIKPHPSGETVKLMNIQVMLSEGEADVLKHTHILTLGAFIAVMPMPEPGQFPRGNLTVRLTGLPVPSEEAERLAGLWRDRMGRERFPGRGSLIRSALHALASEHLHDRWELTRDLHPGTPQARERISVGPDRWVARALWRRKDGTPRVGRRGPASVLTVSGAHVGLPEGEDAYELLGPDWEVLEVFGAYSLHDAALQVINDMPRRTVDVDVLVQQGPEMHRGAGKG